MLTAQAATEWQSTKGSAAAKPKAETESTASPMKAVMSTAILPVFNASYGVRAARGNILLDANATEWQQWLGRQGRVHVSPPFTALISLKKAPR